MKPSRTLLTLSTLALAFGTNAAAKAEDDIALSFELEPTKKENPADSSAEAADAVVAEVIPDSSEAPLPVPPEASNPPVSNDAGMTAGVYGGLDAIALGNNQSIQALLPAPPPTSTPASVLANPAEELASTEQPGPVAEFTEEIDSILLAFDMKKSAGISLAAKGTTEQAEAQTPALLETADLMADIFQGGTESLVARAVGSAEGTRTPEGNKTPAYFGHTDPGNQVWNLGTFSYQHGAQTPEEADSKQLKRLHRQTLVLKQKAREHGLELSKEELLNGIDLANQAPLAALDRGGYIDWLAEAHKQGMQGSEAIAWARTQSFIDPDTKRWNAPGLGNNAYSIRRDQERRMSAISRAIQSNPLAPKELVIAQTTPELTSENGISETFQSVEEDFAFSLDTALKNATSQIAELPAQLEEGEDSPENSAIAELKVTGRDPVDTVLPVEPDELLTPKHHQTNEAKVIEQSGDLLTTIPEGADLSTSSIEATDQTKHQASIAEAKAEVEVGQSTDGTPAQQDPFSRGDVVAQPESVSEKKRQPKQDKPLAFPKPTIYLPDETNAHGDTVEEFDWEDVEERSSQDKNLSD